MRAFFSDLVLFLIILPSPCMAGFCFHQVILPRTIEVDFQTRQIPSEDGGSQWELVANVTWQRRQDISDFGGYAVRGAPSQITEPLSVLNCSLAGFLETEDETYLFTGLRFGYKYFFGVSAIDEARSKRTSIEAFKQQESPDCYLETGDREFCRTQSVEISGVPLDFQVDCVAPSLSDQGDTGQYTAVLSWTPPIQVNGRITDYELRYGKSSSNFAEHIPYYKKTKVYRKELRHLEEFSNFTAQVRAFVDGKGGPKATLKFNTYHEQLANDLSHQSECDELF